MRTNGIAMKDSGDFYCSGFDSAVEFCTAAQGAASLITSRPSPRRIIRKDRFVGCVISRFELATEWVSLSSIT
jgi:hypothetical protein